MGDRAYTNYCHKQLSGILVHSASNLMLGELARDRKKARASLRASNEKRKNLFKTVDHISDYFDRSVGSPSVVRELAARSVEKHWYRHDCHPFSAEAPQAGDRNYAEELAVQIHTRSTRLVEDEEAMRDHFGQFSSVLSVRERCGESGQQGTRVNSHAR